MITHRRTDNKMPKCGRCGFMLSWWDMRNDERTYRCDHCQKKEIAEAWEKTVKEMFNEIKRTNENS